MNSFIAWKGGKHLLAKTIVKKMPPHICYVEVFGGAGWVLFRKPQEMSKVEVYNDLNSDLVNLFRVVRDKHEQFFYRQYFLLASREEYQNYQQRCKDGVFKDDIERAIAFYYLIKNSFGAGIFTGWAFGRTRPPKQTDFAYLAAISERLKKTYIDNKSFDKLIASYDSEESLFYCDPPYTMAQREKCYQHEFTSDDHRKLADILKGIKGKFILSYDDSPVIRKLYDGLNIQTTNPVRYSTNCRPGIPRREKVELIITNF